MAPQQPNARSDAPGGDAADPGGEGALLERLDDAFGQRFVVVDPTRSVLERVSPDWPRADAFRWLSLCEHVSRRGRAEVLEDYAPLLLLAAPLEATDDVAARVAITVLVTDTIESPAAVEAAARVFGVDATDAWNWSRDRAVWSPKAAIRLAEALVENHAAHRALRTHKAQLADVSSHLLATFDELDVLHRLSERLSLDRSTRDTCAETLKWLADVVPAECVAARWRTVDVGPNGERWLQQETLLEGRSPIPPAEIDRFIDRLGPQAARRSMVLNRDRTDSPTWCYPGVREVVVAPIRTGGDCLGWIFAMNHREPRGPHGSGAFGSVESSLLSSVASILGVHYGNRRLFHQQRALFDGAVVAFSSALDAKDHYTRGHSDRVAQIAVRLAEEMGVGEADRGTLRLGGLLHDIGKIGIDDRVLRKAGKLTDDEYEHIKTHPELGEQILRGVPQLDAILPVVRHHHEAWDGSGYPDGLRGEATPLLARITAVADAIDAMGGDRPYRVRMPIDRVEAILRDGAGKQWDAEVVDAYFAVRDDVLAILVSQPDPDADERAEPVDAESAETRSDEPLAVG